jgi:hypothetical protein
MRHSQGKSDSTRFSRQQARNALREALNVGAHNAEMAAMFRLLEQMGLIEKQGEACAQWYGRLWAVLPLV